jgi:hypothetical protein
MTANHSELARMQFIVPADFHRKMKIMSAAMGISMTDMMINTMTEQIFNKVTVGSDGKPDDTTWFQYGTAMKTFAREVDGE